VVAARPLAVAVGLGLDALAGEPPLDPHPVAAFGAAMAAHERRWYADRRGAGVWHAAAGLAVGAGAGAAIDALAALAAPPRGTESMPNRCQRAAVRHAGTAAAVYVAVAGRALREAAAAVGDALAVGDLDRARAELPALVGRDPSGLGPREITRAVVESLAENTVDAVVAPAVWGLAAGAAGALGYRAVNTMDAMVGHRSARYRNYGWAAARLDDAANWVPARLTAVLVAAVRPARAAEVWRVVTRDAPAHPSPNAGVAEAAWAAALGLRLGGTNRYGDRTEIRAPLGFGAAPVPADIRRASALTRDVTVALGAALAAAAGWRGARRRR